MTFLQAAVAHVRNLYPVTPGFLGDIAGRIRCTHGAGKVGGAAVNGNNADADAERKSRFTPGEVECFDRLEQVVCNLNGLVQRTVLEQHAEFIATKPAQGIPVPYRTQQQLCQLL